MELSVLSAIIKNFAEVGILGMGWVAFLWAMMQLRYERTRYQHLVVHIIEYFTKVNILRDIEGGNDTNVRSVPDFDGRIGRIFDSNGDGLSGLIPKRRRERRERTRSREDREDVD